MILPPLFTNAKTKECFDVSHGAAYTIVTNVTWQKDKYWKIGQPISKFRVLVSDTYVFTEACAI